MNKRGQVTLFIIIAIIIVAAMVIVIYPRIKASFIPTVPASSFEKCLMPSVTEAVDIVSKQGGSINPSLYYMYQGNKIEYLCYTYENYKTCVMQQPMLKKHVENEIASYVKPTAIACLSQLKTEMEGQGYTSQVNFKDVSVELASNDVQVTINTTASFTREGTQSFNKFVVSESSKLYELVMLSTSILNSEALYGDSEITTYMIYYPNIKLEKLKQGDGSKVYILNDTTTQDTFQFATRSLAWPGGFKITA
jgi:hypothetical protein